MSQKVLLIEENNQLISQNIDNQLEFVVLPHPKSADIVYMCINNEVYEVQDYEPRKYSSYFINQRVCSSNSLLVSNKIDIRFLLLPFLMKSQRYQPMNQILTHADGSMKLFPFLKSKPDVNLKLDEMCDVNSKMEDMIFYRYNEEKALSWLLTKVLRCARLLYKKRINLLKNCSGNAAFASGFNLGGASNLNSTDKNGSTNDTSKCVESKPDVEYQNEDIKVALQIVCEYIPEEMEQKLLKYSGLTELPGLSDDVVELDMENASKSVEPGVVTAGEKRKLSSWEADLEMEKESLNYFNTGGTNTNKREEKGLKVRGIEDI